MTETEMMGWEEAIAHVMRATGKNRRQARAALIKKMRSGELPAWGELDDGTIEPIPPGCWRLEN